MRALGLREVVAALVGVAVFACAAGVPDSFFPGRVAVVVLGCGGGILALLLRRDRGLPGSAFVLGGMVAGVSVATLAWSIDLWTTGLWVGHVASYAGMAIAVALLFDDDERARILVLAATVGVIYSALRGIEQVAWGLEQTEKIARESGLVTEGSAFAARLASRRAFGGFVSPATYGGVALFCIPLAVVCACGTRERALRLAGWAGVVLGACAVVLSGSKAALAAALVVALLLLAGSWRRLRPAVRWLVLAVVVVAVAGGLAVGRRLGTGALAESARVRLGYWQGAMRVWEDYPLGVGLGNFGLAYPRVKEAVAEETQLVHNDYLQLLAEAGPLAAAGLFALALVVVAAAASAGRFCAEGEAGGNLLRLGRRAAAVACALALVRAAVDYVLYEPSQGVLFGMALGLAAGGCREWRPSRSVVHVLLGLVLALACALGGLALGVQARRDRAGMFLAAATRVLEGDVDVAVALLRGEAVPVIAPGLGGGVVVSREAAKEAAAALGLGEPSTLEGGDAVWGAADALLREAEAVLRRAARLAPGDPQTLASLAEVLAMRAGVEEDRALYGEALRCLGEAIAKDGAGRAWLRGRMAELLLAMRDRTGAARWLEEAAALYPTKPEYRFRLARLYAGMGRVEEARAQAQEALALRESLYDRGRYEALAGEAEWARSYLEGGL